MIHLFCSIGEVFLIVATKVPRVLVKTLYMITVEPTAVSYHQCMVI